MLGPCRPLEYMSTLSLSVVDVMPSKPVCACVRACMRVCVRACACARVRVCVRTCACVYSSCMLVDVLVVVQCTLLWYSCV